MAPTSTRLMGAFQLGDLPAPKLGAMGYKNLSPRREVPRWVQYAGLAVLAVVTGIVVYMAVAG